MVGEATDDLLHRLQRQRVLRIDREAFERLLAEGTVLDEEETMVAGSIRVLELGGGTLLLEQDPEGQAYLRLLSSRTEARHLIENRLAIYERMWDGCGCRVDYED